MYVGVVRSGRAGSADRSPFGKVCSACELPSLVTTKTTIFPGVRSKLDASTAPCSAPPPLSRRSITSASIRFSASSLCRDSIACVTSSLVVVANERTLMYPTFLFFTCKVLDVTPFNLMGLRSAVKSRMSFAPLCTRTLTFDPSFPLIIAATSSGLRSCASVPSTFKITSPRCRPISLAGDPSSRRATFVPRLPESAISSTPNPVNSPLALLKRAAY
mmetsp:Transcript_17027/g.28551  ORF Transcript_17027/g.28551 Transcript_17027/m.28551 type:complete len:217 (-) Transcript_17027:459-1109(-)